MNDRRRGRLLTRVGHAVDRAWARLADSPLVDAIAQHSKTPQLDLTLCLERLASDEPREILIALRWLQSMASPHTARASTRVVELTEHGDPEVAACARQTVAAMRAKFGDDWTA